MFVNVGVCDVRLLPRTGEQLRCGIFDLGGFLRPTCHNAIGKRGRGPAGAAGRLCVWRNRPLHLVSTPHHAVSPRA